jgi:hypothetical protein|tara:strand:- start:208 stop:753 length:546 start_codon:yes stop_codon:yes gene_type:complete
MESDYIYVPSIELQVSRETSLHGKNWYETHDFLEGDGERMLTPSEFAEFLRYAKENHQDIYNEIIELGKSWSLEWIDAYFEQREDSLYVLTGNKTKEEKLDENTLMEDKQISLESWIENLTSQGLPSKETKSGNLYYWYPRSNSVAGFGVASGRAVLDGRGIPLDYSLSLGVRAARSKLKI